MKDEINLKLINSLKAAPAGRDIEVWDTKIEGFVLRKRASGAIYYYFCYTHNERLQRMKLGEVDITGLEVARDKARELRGQLAIGIYPKERQEQAALAAEATAAAAKREKTYKQYLDEIYQPYLLNRPKGRPTEIWRTLNNFTNLFDLKLADIKAGDIQAWITRRRSDGIQEATIKRMLNDLRAALNKAAGEYELIKANPMDKMKPIKVDDKGTVRYLGKHDKDEESRLRAALAERDEKMHDYLLPLVLTALGTGCRLGELIALTWKHVDYDNRVVTITGITSKSSTTRHIPMSDEIYAVLKQWEKQPKVSNIDGYVFTHADGRKLGNIHKAWQNLLIKAKIKNFRFHDCRHDFASRLARAGISLAVIKEILGHSDYKLTSRYSHLNDQTKLDAVNRIAKVAG